ncbi:uncharacterized protein YndB with AHSA1/START domain [Plasticicumulans lactativorans]|uniref:Uncharacterized protein YndB with AHSA1/START domain n=1 Tax=Plasticicumulans lactativorans TaxID=1133106 RepID=A0A4R2LB06_9GAMM|nr:SRPBCC family protein [Plasticicumulans lactativorans]TCO83500.1 uncharacterized protein YndB with AHSA1/START domain [Plasticicumulans lactativorans]
MAARLELVTEWTLAAPIDAVWAELSAVEHWPQWWPYLRAVECLSPGDARGVGERRRYRWATRLPYTITFEMRSTAVEPPRLLAGEARGDLRGRGCWQLTEIAGGTCVRYAWSVDVDKPWMRLLAPLARPLFVWNHDALMRAGGEGLARRLGVPLLRHARCEGGGVSPARAGSGR